MIILFFLNNLHTSQVCILFHFNWSGEGSVSCPSILFNITEPVNRYVTNLPTSGTLVHKSLLPTRVQCQSCSEGSRPAADLCIYYHVVSPITIVLKCDCPHLVKALHLLPPPFLNLLDTSFSTLSFTHCLSSDLSRLYQLVFRVVRYSSNTTAYLFPLPHLCCSPPI